MNVGIIGYGKMGKMIHEVASSRGHNIGVILKEPNWQSQEVAGLDVVIEFTNPKSAVENIKKCFLEKVPIVVGSTGWYEHYEQVVTLCKKNNHALLTATNFSIGVNIFWHLNKKLAEIMNEHDDYQVKIKEVHHTEKLDSPSGTAISTAEILINQIERYTSWIESDKQDKTITIESHREPNVPGTHTVSYKNEIDEILFTHKANNRKGFALGAVLAAEFLKDKTGVFQMKDLIKF